MRSAIYASLFVLVFGVFAFAQSKSIDGNWTVEYVGGLAMKTMGGAEFEFHLNGRSSYRYGQRRGGMAGKGSDLKRHV